MQAISDITQQKKQILRSSCFRAQTTKEFNSICLPFLKQFNLSVFEFARVYDDGTAFMLYSDPRISNYVVERQIHITAHVPETILSSEFWYLPEPNGIYSQFTRDIKEIADACSWADYIQRFDGYFDMFCFWSPLDQSLSTNQFINSKESLEQVCYKFRDNAANLLKITAKGKFAMTSQMMPNFKGLGKNEHSASKDAQLDLYLHSLQQQIVKLNASINTKLSSKEQECIVFLMLGKTARDIADCIGISHRTVEMHLNSIKSKLGCQRKSQIVEAIINSNSYRSI